MFDIPYELVVSVHVIAFVFNIVLVVISDFHGLLWMTGKMRTLPQGRMVLFHRLIGVGLGVAIISGAWLFSTASEYLLTVPGFYSKMIFVGALVVNAVFIGKHIHIASTLPYSEITSKEKRALLISGAVSSVSWLGAFVSAHLLGL